MKKVAKEAFSRKEEREKVSGFDDRLTNRWTMHTSVAWFEMDYANKDKNKEN